MFITSEQNKTKLSHGFSIWQISHCMVLIALFMSNFPFETEILKQTHNQMEAILKDG